MSVVAVVIFVGMVPSTRVMCLVMVMFVLLHG
jgi:hypothetical protein